MKRQEILGAGRYCYGILFRNLYYHNTMVTIIINISASDTDLKESHDADDAEELKYVVLLLEVGEYEIKIEGDGGNEVDKVDRFSHERQLVGAHDKPNDQLERKPTVAHTLDKKECLVRFCLAFVQHPRVSGQVGRRRRAVIGGC